MKKFGGIQCSACGEILYVFEKGYVEHKCPKSNLVKRSWKDRLSSKLGL